MFFKMQDKGCLPPEALPDACSALPWTHTLVSATALIVFALYQGGSSCYYLYLCTSQVSGRQPGLKSALPVEPESRSSLSLMPSYHWVPPASKA